MTFKISLIISLFFFISCASHPKKSAVSISTASEGLVKDHALSFPLYLTQKLEETSKIRQEHGDKTYIVHTGHLLKPNFSKEENEKLLSSLSELKIDAYNLTLEDFVIANNQDISFENYPLKFINASVVNLNEDSIITKANISPFIVNEGVALIGLSDNKINDSLNMEQFLVSDYVLAVLKARKIASKLKNIQSLVIVHTIGSEIDNVIDRLPPNFLNSLTD